MGMLFEFQFINVILNLNLLDNNNSYLSLILFIILNMEYTSISNNNVNRLNMYMLFYEKNSFI